MNNKMIILFSVFYFLGFQKSFADQNQTKDTKQKKETAKEKMGEAKLAVKDYTFSQKEEFVTNMNKEIDLLKKDLTDLETKAKKTSKDAKAETDKKIKDAKTSIAKLNEQIETVKSSTESDWEKIKIKFNDSMSEVKKSIARSRKWLSEKIAP